MSTIRTATATLLAALLLTACNGGGTGAAPLDKAPWTKEPPQPTPHYTVTPPSPSPTPVKHRLLPAVRTSAHGAYKLNDEDDRGVRLTFSPCVVTQYKINPAGAPPGGIALVQDGFTALSKRTGLAFHYSGTTAERPTRGRHSPVGHRPLPVLVAWDVAEKFSATLEDNHVLGVGGPDFGFLSLEDKHMHFVTGMIVLDKAAGVTNTRAEQRATLLHELGHLVGLKHVNDKKQLMYPQGPGEFAFQQVRSSLSTASGLLA